MLSFLFVSADVALNHYQFFRIIGVIIDGLKVKYEILDGFEFSFFEVILFTSLFTLALRWFIALVGGSSESDSAAEKKAKWF